MHKTRKHIAPLLLLAATLACSAIQAQTISIAPANESTAVGKTRQYVATVTGLSSTAVDWYAGGVFGGSSASGTIDMNGLYTAPLSIPGQNPVTIRAISKAAGTTTGFVYTTILSAGPVLSSVSPNPLPGGSYTIMVTGSGFVSGANIYNTGVQLPTAFVNSTTLKSTGYQGAVTAAYIQVRNPGSAFSNYLAIPVSGTSSGGGGSSTAPVISPKNVAVVAGATRQFTAAGATGWTAVSGAVSATGLYTAPAAPGTDTVTATNATGSSASSVTVISNVPPAITGIGVSPLSLGVFSTTITGTGFIAQSAAQMNGAPLTTVYNNPTTLTVTGYSGTGGTVNLTVSNATLVSPPFSVQVGVQNPHVSASAARRFLEQAAFGPTPADAAHVQTIGIPAWIAEQLAMPSVSNYSNVHNSQQGMPVVFLSNAVTNPDQLHQRVALALSEIFVTSLNKLIWNGDMIPYQNMLIADTFTNFRKILGDVTLSPGMGEYLDMANNAKANPVQGTVANENYAREIMQLFSVGTKLLNQNGTPILDAANQQIPTYLQNDVAELARVFTGWTYAAKPGGQAYWNAYINSSGPMVPLAAMHDFGAKTLINGHVAAAGLSPLADLNGALDNLATHPNTAPFISKQLIQHLVKSNPTPGYVQRVADAFVQSNGDMPTSITAILLDQEARANDNGGADQANDGHLQEPALYLPGYIRAFNGQMTTSNYYASNLAALGQDLFSSPSVFNYFAPGYVIAGTGGLNGPEFQINNPNASVLRENLVASFFNAYNNAVQTYGPGTTVDLTPFVPLAATPATLVDALDLTLTHGTMPAAMKQIIVAGVTADAAGSIHRVQTGVYLILTSNYYNVWH